MSWHVYRCATCGKLCEGAAWYASDAPRLGTGQIDPTYRDSDPPRYCSLECREKAER
jgi:hypothetical protein